MADPMTAERLAEMRIADIKETLTGLFIELREKRDALSAAQQEITALRGAAEVLLNRYVGLVNSGDAGFWNPENEPEVQAVRAALAPR